MRFLSVPDRVGLIADTASLKEPSSRNLPAVGDREGALRGTATRVPLLACPKLTPIELEGHYRVRRDRIDKAGKVTLRYRSRLLHLGVGRAHAGEQVTLLVANRDVRVVSPDGEILAEFTIDPTKNYQPRKKNA